MNELQKTLLIMSREHTRNADFYRDSKDRTYSEALLAVEMMHRDTAKILKDTAEGGPIITVQSHD